MATCPQCGQNASVWSRDVFTGACPRCQAGGTRPANLGCGTLILIGLIVLFVSRTGLSDLKSNASLLHSSVEELKKVSDAQTNELRELRRAVEELRKSGAGKDDK
jgi:hypothetical protein